MIGVGVTLAAIMVIGVYLLWRRRLLLLASLSQDLAAHPAAAHPGLHPGLDDHRDRPAAVDRPGAVADGGRGVDHGVHRRGGDDPRHPRGHLHRRVRRLVPRDAGHRPQGPEPCRERRRRREQRRAERRREEAHDRSAGRLVRGRGGLRGRVRDPGRLRSGDGHPLRAGGPGRRAPRGAARHHQPGVGRQRGVAHPHRRPGVRRVPAGLRELCSAGSTWSSC